MLPRRVSIDEAPLLLYSADSCSRRLSLVRLLPNFLGEVLRTSLEGCLISFFFAEVGDTCCFHFPMLLSHLSLLAAYGCSLILGSRTIVLRVTRSRIVTLLQIQFVRCGI